MRKETFCNINSSSRDGTFIFGYSFGGIMACHAAWTRPGANAIKLFSTVINNFL